MPTGVYPLEKREGLFQKGHKVLGGFKEGNKLWINNIGKKYKPMSEISKKNIGLSHKGLRHSKETKETMSKIMKERWKNPQSKYNSKEYRQYISNFMTKLSSKRIREGGNIYSRTLKAWRTIGDKKHYFRSKWEINIAYYFEWLKKNGEIKKWEYEPDTFWFEKIKRGIRSYTPDFKITDKNGDIYYVEVKGYMDRRSKTKLKRMRIYYPKIKISVYEEDMYKALKRQVGVICGWE